MKNHFVSSSFLKEKFLHIIPREISEKTKTILQNIKKYEKSLCFFFFFERKIFTYNPTKNFRKNKNNIAEYKKI